MRWLVEVTSLGQAGTESITVEADSWHKALESARRQRGEAPNLTGFSIELVENGCKAIDSVSRLRYAVTTDLAGAAPTPAISPAPADRASLASEVAATQAKPFNVAFKREHDPTDAVPLTYREYVLAVPPGTAESSAEDLLRRYLQTVRTSLVNSPAGKVVNIAVFEAPFDERRAARAIATLNWKDWNAEPSISFPRLAPGPVQGQPDRGAGRSSIAQPPVSPAPAAASFPTGAAPRPPAESAPTSPVAQLSGPPVRVAESSPIAAAPRLAAESNASAPIAAPLGSAVQSVESAAIAAPVDRPAELAAASPSSPPPGAPGDRTVEPLTAQSSNPLHAVLPNSPDTTDGVAGPDRSPQGPLEPSPRLSGEELLAELFESMHELQFARDPVSGGDFCLSIAMGTMAVSAGIVHLYDIARREFFVSSAAGARVGPIRNRRHPESDPMLSRAMRMRGALVIADVAAAEENPLPARYTDLGGARSIVMARASLGGRFLGAIELIDPLDGLPFTTTEGNALTYIAEQFAEFVASRGMVMETAAPPRPTRGR